MNSIILKTAQETESVAEKLAATISAPTTIYLEGPLGAGKTTFVRGFLRGLGYRGTVKSPTFTLIESYDLNDTFFLHADLYRIKEAVELENIGFRDYFNTNTIALIEWASHAAMWLPEPDILCTLRLLQDQQGRELTIERIKK